MSKRFANQQTHEARLARAAKAKRDANVNLDNWNQVLVDDRLSDNISGSVPQLRAKLGGEKTNAELAKEWGVTSRQASKIRNHKKPKP